LRRGWINYFKLASIQGKLKKLEEWLRNRLRYCIWADWKKPDRKSLIRLGIGQGMADAWSRTRMGGWAEAQSSILRTTKPIKHEENRGSIRLVNYYKLASISIEPLSTRPAWFILSLTKDLWCEPRTGGHLTVSCLLDYVLLSFF
jgi:hypothetical protein